MPIRSEPFLFIGALYMLLIWAGLRWARWRVNRRASQLAEGLRASGITIVAERPTAWAWRPAELELEQGARVTVRQWGRNSHLISMIVSGPPSPSVWIRKERAVDRVAKGLGLEREVELGVADFDRELYVASRADDGAVRAALAKSETQQLIREIVGSGFGVHLSSRGVSGSTWRWALTPFDAAVVPPLLEKLRELAKTLPQASAIDEPRPLHTGALLAATFVSLFVPMFLMVGLRDAVNPPIESGHVLLAMLLGLVPWLLVSVLIAKKLQRRPLAMLEVPAVALSLMVSVPILFACLLFFINAQLDGSPAVQHRAKIVDWYKHNRGTVYVSPWEMHARQKIILPQSILPVQLGDELEIEAHEGRLGWPWVSRVARANQ
jgi:hypothetical protein